MSRLSCKICILGGFAVGKTSTVERFVNNQFSEKYLTTIGVKIDTREVEVSDTTTLKLVLWDVAGTDHFGAVELAYLRGAAGLIFVADGTRADTIPTALDLRKQAEGRYGELPSVFLLNKADLSHAWEVTSDREGSLRDECAEVFTTSAKTGANVAEALDRLAELIAARDFVPPQ